MPDLTVNGTSFEYVERGSGDMMLFVHGSVSDYRTWQAQQDAFSPRFRSIAYSRRYHWPNAAIAAGADYAMAEQVDDLEAFIHARQIAPFHFVRPFVRRLSRVAAGDPRTAAFPQPRVGGAADRHPAGRSPPQPPQILKLLVTRPAVAVAIIKFAATGLAPASSALKRGDPDKAVQIFGHATLGRAAFEHLSQERMAQVRDNLIEAEFLGSGFLPVDPAEVGRVQVPTLLINGAESPRLFHRLVERLHELLPHSKRIVLPGASHIAHEDNPDAYNAAVAAFIDQLA